jgi:invasion protein IalB
MRIVLAIVLSFGGSALAPSAFAASIANEHFRTQSIHGDWIVLCSGQKNCFSLTTASISGGREGEISLSVDRTGGSKRTPRLTVTIDPNLCPSRAPEILVGDGPLVKLGHFDHGPDHCVASADLTAKLLSRLKAEKTAEVEISRRLQNAIMIPVSLVGFSAAFNALP